MALVPQTEELQREVETVQQLRRALHDAYIVESALGRRSARETKKAPGAMEVHRTVDAPTLNVLKAPNYPFTLCEEAPPSYVPPPVPYDVEGEIDSLKQRVLQVQEDFQRYEKQVSRAANAPLSRSQVIDFFSHNATYAEMAWEVSSLQWFYRWVLSHSISHLWNCKEQLEYVLTEGGQELPQTAEEMDWCLQELPFSAAVSVLDTDRQAVVAQERRRLRSVSRTFRDRLPSEAVTIATSCYLTAEEKYMYQEFFNQSEHMLLLLNHTLMLNKANSGLIHDGQQHHGQQSSAVGMLSNSLTSAPRGASAESGAVMVAPDSMVGEMETSVLAEETRSAVAAEQEVITTLMKTIRERQQRDEFFDVSEAEYQHSRTAQIAVYGCVLSDMSLMGQQMSLAAEFVERYEGWLQLRGFQTHEELMSELSRRSGGTAWPTVRIHGDDVAESGHDHFVPPTEEMMKRHPRPAADPKLQESGRSEASSAVEADEPRVPKRQPQQQQKPSQQQQRQPSAAAAPAPNAAPKVRAAPKAATTPPAAAPPAPAAAKSTSTPPPVTASARSSPASSQASKKGPASMATAAAAAAAAAPPTPSPSTQSSAAAPPPAANTAADVANAYFCILEATTATSTSKNDAAVSRAWLAAAVRYTFVKILRREWDVAVAARSIAQAEEDLLGRLRRGGALSRLTSTAAALCVVAQEAARLCVARCEMRSLTAEVPVVVHVPEDADDYTQFAADVRNPVELQRWGSVVDALWLQADPSGMASGGMLMHPVQTESSAGTPTRANKHSAAHFLYIESIDAPPTPQNSCTAVMTLRYRLSRMSPEATASRRVAPSLAAVSGAQPSANQGMARYALARRVLTALFEVEARGLLPCLASRVSEAATVPLAQVMYVTFDDSNTSVVVDKTHMPLLCLLPPPAIELKRMHADVGTAPVTDDPQDQYYRAYAAPVHFSTIGMMVGSLLEDLAIRVPVLSDLYMTAATLREQALWEVQNNTPCKCFVNATTQPIPVACAPAKTRAISIQRESTVNRNTTTTQRFVSPLLRRVEDTIASIESGTKGGAVAAAPQRSTGVRNGAGANSEGSVSTPRGGAAPQQQPHQQLASVTGRQTQMVGGGHGAASPSPSAIRPNRM